MTDTLIDQLFDEFAVRHARGEQPDVRGYLERAGAERDILGRMIDRLLQTVPAAPPTEEDTVLMQARLSNEPPVLVLRRRRKLGRQAVVSALMTSLGIGSEKREKVAAYYHDLEVGRLDPTGVNRGVWRALNDSLAANVERLASVRAVLSVQPDAVYLRAAEPETSSSLFVPAAAEKPDEVDRLFTGGN